MVYSISISPIHNAVHPHSGYSLCTCMCTPLYSILPSCACQTGHRRIHRIRKSALAFPPESKNQFNSAKETKQKKSADPKIKPSIESNAHNIRQSCLKVHHQTKPNAACRELSQQKFCFLFSFACYDRYGEEVYKKNKFNSCIDATQ